jgi:hypothetical protein
LFSPLVCFCQVIKGGESSAARLARLEQEHANQAKEIQRLRNELQMAEQNIQARKQAEQAAKALKQALIEQAQQAKVCFCCLFETLFFIFFLKREEDERIARERERVRATEAHGLAMQKQEKKAVNFMSMLLTMPVTEEEENNFAPVAGRLDSSNKDVLARMMRERASSMSTEANSAVLPKKTTEVPFVAPSVAPAAARKPSDTATTAAPPPPPPPAPVVVVAKAKTAQQQDSLSSGPSASDIMAKMFQDRSRASFVSEEPLVVVVAEPSLPPPPFPAVSAGRGDGVGRGRGRGDPAGRGRGRGRGE